MMGLPIRGKKATGDFYIDKNRLILYSLKLHIEYHEQATKPLRLKIIKGGYIHARG
jgi:hypothetical protein